MENEGDDPREDATNSRGEPDPIPLAVVGIGASAGGLAAIQRFLTGSSELGSMALVLLVHHDPHTQSQLPSILPRFTDLTVTEVHDREPLQAGHLYVCPSDKMVAIEQRELRLYDRTERHLHTVDPLFTSLAGSCATRCAAVVLSGSGSDGARGVVDVKESGGLVLVQDEATAEYPGMPAAARATRHADVILAPEKMPAVLSSYFNTARVLEESGERSGEDFSQQAADVFARVRRRTGHDFTAYKESTMRRRIERRMSLSQTKDFAAYSAYLHSHEDEVELLFRDLLIGVTSFFRDYEAFESLQEQLRTSLAQSSDGTFRAWLPGCSTGEEPYSVAITILECIEELGLEVSPQLFATDIDSTAIAVAREGIFSATAIAFIPEERLRRYFVPVGDSFRIRKAVRDCLVFSTQDVLRDPPFSRLDLLVCRNLLIYLKPEAQQQLIPLFHHTLRPGGCLMLGSSESLGRFNDLFSTIDSGSRIFQRREIPLAAYPTIAFPTGVHTPKASPLADAITDGGEASETVLEQQVQQALLSGFVPSAVVVNSRGDIVYVHGRTGRFLEPAPGPSRMNLLTMARAPIRLEVGKLLRQATNENRMQTLPPIPLRTNGELLSVKLVVQPLQTTCPDSRFLVVFQDAAMVEPRKSSGEPRANGSTELEDLRGELRRVSEAHQATVEELESSNEELQSANEELQSANEELQSTNEELVSSKEELQSMNEELATVNSELRAKVNDLARVRDDMTNLLHSTHIATLFLDQELCIRRFTPEAKELINLLPTDEGRPLDHFSCHFDIGLLLRAAKDVLRSLQAHEEEIQTSDEGKWHLMRVLPYRTIENVIDGVVVTFTDVTAQRDIEVARDREQAFALAVFDTVREPLLVLDRALVVRKANRSYCDFFQTTQSDTAGRGLFELADRAWEGHKLEEALTEVSESDSTVEALAIERNFPGIGRRRLLLNARRVRTDDELILLAMLEQPWDGDDASDP